MVKKLELSKKEHLELKKICKFNKIEFLSSAFDIESIKLINSININFILIT